MSLEVTWGEIADAAGTTGLRTYRTPPDKVAAPAAVVSLPDTAAYGESLDAGQHSCRLILHVIVSRANMRAASRALLSYLDTTGPQSIPAAIESASWTAADSVTVLTAEVDVITYAGTDYLDAAFTLEVVWSKQQ